MKLVLLNLRKNVADGEGAVAKQMLDTGVKIGEAFIDNAQAAVNYLRQKLSGKDCKNCHETHSFKVVALLNDIPRPEMPQINAVKGLQKQHCMKPDRLGTVFPAFVQSVMRDL